MRLRVSTQETLSRYTKVYKAQGFTLEIRKIRIFIFDCLKDRLAILG